MLNGFSTAMDISIWLTSVQVDRHDFHFLKVIFSSGFKLSSARKIPVHNLEFICFYYYGINKRERLREIERDGKSLKLWFYDFLLRFIKIPNFADSVPMQRSKSTSPRVILLNYPVSVSIYIHTNRKIQYLTIHWRNVMPKTDRSQNKTMHFRSQICMVETIEKSLHMHIQS